MTRRIILLAVIVLAIHFGSSSTTLIYGQPTEDTKASPPAPAAEDFIEGNYWALIIGIDKYPNLRGATVSDTLHEWCLTLSWCDRMVRKSYGSGRH
jgi:hypothetical protein